MNQEECVRETLDSVESLIQGLRNQMDTELPKPSVADYLRLVQLRLDLSKEHEKHDRRPLHVRWVSDESTPEPDPDPTVPWPGDESLD